MMEPLLAGHRASGVLLHPTSLPGPAIGDLGNSAYRFVDWLVRAGQACWQILPLGPADSGGSPYNSLSALAGNPLLISPELLARDDLLEPSYATPPQSGSTDIDYPSAVAWKDGLLRAAHRRYRRSPDAALAAEFDAFRSANEAWLNDYTLFRAVRDFHGGAAWGEWPAEVRDRSPEALERWRATLGDEVERFAFQQFLFDRQWRALRGYAHDRGVQVVGDLPIFVAHDSADVWAHREIFRLGPDGAPLVVAGVPPDYFSATGQRWGNPLYRWDVLRKRDYDWWIERFRRTLDLVDVVRIDHFRGFESYWEIDAAEETAVNGRWVAGPGLAFFRAVEKRLGSLPVIAEDLGLITAEVERLRDDLGYPGMRVLQFAFDGDPHNPHLPENFPTGSVAYTGTHDNDTIMGWWRAADPELRRRVHAWFGGGRPDAWAFIEAVLASRAALAVVPLQDLLGLGSEGRMNTPGDASRNWTWRMAELPGADTADRLRKLSLANDRHGPLR
jgi:4-alpha-glucanotransferase